MVPQLAKRERAGSGDDHESASKATQLCSAHYYARCQDADRDADFLRAEALHFSGLQAMERLHVPCYYTNRVAFAERVGFPGMIPGVPLENLACTAAQHGCESGARATLATL